MLKPKCSSFSQCVGTPPQFLDLTNYKSNPSLKVSRVIFKAFSKISVVSRNMNVFKILDDANSKVTMFGVANIPGHKVQSDRGKTIERSEVNGKFIYVVLLDESPDFIIKVSQCYWKYIADITSTSTVQEPESIVDIILETEDLLDGAIEEDEDEDEEEEEGELISTDD
ncbi:hypothetical protein K501DRAFT_265355 [Backusella circina FSU 941]|nr:hypothetical protein K501DRAFT_265355 [Backusella circina FSU 941]